jgi:hypothetical protein
MRCKLLLNFKRHSPFNFYFFLLQVDPILEENPEFKDKILAPQIKKYYKFNEVSRFQYSRPFTKGQRDRDNEFGTLWVSK